MLLWFEQKQLIPAILRGLLGNAQLICLWCELLKKFQWQVDGDEGENTQALYSFQIKLPEYVLSICFKMKSKVSRTYLPKLTINNIN